MKERRNLKQAELLKEYTDLIFSVCFIPFILFLIYKFGYKDVINSPYNLDHIWKASDLIRRGSGFIIPLVFCMRNIISSTKAIRSQRSQNVDNKVSNDSDDEI